MFMNSLLKYQHPFTSKFRCLLVTNTTLSSLQTIETNLGAGSMARFKILEGVFAPVYFLCLSLVHQIAFSMLTTDFF